MSDAQRFVDESMIKIREATAKAPSHEQLFAAIEELMQCLVMSGHEHEEHEAPAELGEQTAPEPVVAPEQIQAPPPANDTAQSPDETA